MNYQSTHFPHHTVWYRSSGGGDYNIIHIGQTTYMKVGDTFVKYDSMTKKTEVVGSRDVDVNGWKSTILDKDKRNDGVITDLPENLFYAFKEDRDTIYIVHLSNGYKFSCSSYEHGMKILQKVIDDVGINITKKDQQIIDLHRKYEVDHMTEHHCIEQYNKLIKTDYLKAIAIAQSYKERFNKDIKDQ